MVDLMRRRDLQPSKAAASGEAITRPAYRRSRPPVEFAVMAVFRRARRRCLLDDRPRLGEPSAMRSIVSLLVFASTLIACVANPPPQQPCACTRSPSRAPHAASGETSIK
jgi:hypothetical protein